MSLPSSLTKLLPMCRNKGRFKDPNILPVSILKQRSHFFAAYLPTGGRGTGRKGKRLQAGEGMHEQECTVAPAVCLCVHVLSACIGFLLCQQLVAVRSSCTSLLSCQPPLANRTDGRPTVPALPCPSLMGQLNLPHVLQQLVSGALAPSSVMLSELHTVFLILCLLPGTSQWPRAGGQGALSPSYEGSLHTLVSVT